MNLQLYVEMVVQLNLTWGILDIERTYNISIFKYVS